MSMVALRRWSLLGAGVAAALPALALTSNQLLAQLTAHRIQPRCEFHPAREAAGGQRVFVGFHGLWSPDWFKPQLEYLQSRGDVLLGLNGARVDATPQALIQELTTRGLLDRPVYVIGFSMGSQTAVQFMRLYRQATGRSVAGAAIVSGMATPADVIWPQPWLPVLMRWLRGGPLVQLGWRRYWQAKAAAARAAGLVLDVQQAEGALLSHSDSVVSGTRLLQRSLGLVPGEFDGVATLFVEHPADPRVRNCYQRWQPAFPTSRLVTMVVPGHGEFTLCREAYIEAYDEWLADAA